MAVLLKTLNLWDKSYTVENIEASTGTVSIYRMKTPLGAMICGATDKGICLFDFEYRKSAPRNYKRIQTLLDASFREEKHDYHDLLAKQVNEYFAGERKEFDLPLHLVGSDFQLRVWNELLKIPFGTTRTYKEQSLILGDLKAIRAVAGANGENAIAIIVPCHRIIGEDGSLTGYAGGLPAKKWLLEHEARISGKEVQASLF